MNMTRLQVLKALTLQVQIMRETRAGDALADLLTLAYPDDPPFPELGYGEGIEVIRSQIETLIRSWQRVGRLNLPGATPYREAALAAAFVLGRAEEAALTDQPRHR